MSSFFFCELQLTTDLILICDSYMSSSTRFVSLKLCVGFSIFDSVWFLLQFIFLLNNMNSPFGFNPNKAVLFKVEGSFSGGVIWYQYNFIPFLNNLFEVCWRWKNADIICYKLDVISFFVTKKCQKIRKINENRWE